MAKRTARHIGDDQLVHGMPKRMVDVSTQESLAKYQNRNVAQDANADEGEMYPAKQGQWQASPGACD